MFFPVWIATCLIFSRISVMFKIPLKLFLIKHACNLSTCEAETGGLLLGANHNHDNKPKHMPTLQF